MCMYHIVGHFVIGFSARFKQQNNYEIELWKSNSEIDFMKMSWKHCSAFQLKYLNYMVDSLKCRTLLFYCVTFLFYKNMILWFFCSLKDSICLKSIQIQDRSFFDVFIPAKLASEVLCDISKTLEEDAFCSLAKPKRLASRNVIPSAYSCLLRKYKSLKMLPAWRFFVGLFLLLLQG